MIKNSGGFKGEKLNALYAKIEAVGKKKVVVGVPGGNASRDGAVYNVTIAFAHEFGVRGHIPERSFLRSTVAEKGKETAEGIAKCLKANLESGESLEKSLEIGGAFIAGQVQAKIQRGINPPLNPKTIARKGSSKPLIDTGRLIQSITWEIRDK